MKCNVCEESTCSRSCDELCKAEQCSDMSPVSITVMTCTILSHDGLDTCRQRSMADELRRSPQLRIPRHQDQGVGAHDASISVLSPSVSAQGGRFGPYKNIDEEEGRECHAI